MHAEPTTGELLQVIEKGFEQVDKRFMQMDDRFGQIDDRLGKMDDRFGQIDQSFEEINNRIDEVLEAVAEFSTHVDGRFDRLEGRVTKVESQMVTKSYLDDKLADLRSDLIVLARKGNLKLSELIEELTRQGVLSNKAAQLIMAMEPFAQG